MSNFKTIFVSVFVVAALAAVLVFSGLVGGSSSSTSSGAAVQGTAVLWGTFSQQAMAPFLQDFGLRNQDVHITYVDKDPSTFADDLVEAIADGTPPDLVILPDNLINRFEDKLTHIPYASLPALTFDTTFVSGASIFSATDGTLAIPWAADPLVMYYNRDLLQSANIVTPPATWQAFSDSISSLTIKKPDLTLTQSAAALGTFANIGHAKDILALLFLQNGNSFITDGVPVVTNFDNETANAATSVGTQALAFYTSFADPAKAVYTWNAGQPEDLDAFTQSSLAYYFGSASELPAIQATNPNLNFDVALPPQENATTVTTGLMYGLAIPKIAPNQQLSYAAATLLANAASEAALTSKAGTTLALMPVRRDVLAQAPVDDPYLGLLYKAALVQKTWFDPNPEGTDQAFGTLITDISSGLLTPDQALSKAASTIGTFSR